MAGVTSAPVKGEGLFFYLKKVRKIGRDVKGPAATGQEVRPDRSSPGKEKARLKFHQ